MLLEILLEIRMDDTIKEVRHHTRTASGSQPQVPAHSVSRLAITATMSTAVAGGMAERTGGGMVSKKVTMPIENRTSPGLLRASSPGLLPSTPGFLEMMLSRSPSSKPSSLHRIC